MVSDYYTVEELAIVLDVEMVSAAELLKGIIAFNNNEIVTLAQHANVTADALMNGQPSAKTSKDGGYKAQLNECIQLLQNLNEQMKFFHSNLSTIYYPVSQTAKVQYS